VKRQIFREQIPHHRPLSGNIYAEHHGFPHPGRWHPNPQGILPPNPLSGHHFDSPNVIITDEDFNIYGSTLQHIDDEIANAPGVPVHAHGHAPAPIHHGHPPPLPQAIHQALPHGALVQGQGHGIPFNPRKRRPIKVVVHHQPAPMVHRYPVEYGKLIPVGVAVTHGGDGAGPGIDGPVLPIIAAHHHNTFEGHGHESPGPALSYAQEYKHVAHEHEQKAIPHHLKFKNLFHRLKIPPGFATNKFSVPVLKSTAAFPLRYGTHDERGKHGAFSYSIAY
jgi:hypothetical protein